MRNRHKYITKVNEYDMCCKMVDAGVCPMRALRGEYPAARNMTCKALPEDCPACVQRWLNEKAT